MPTVTVTYPLELSLVRALLDAGVPVPLSEGQLLVLGEQEDRERRGRLSLEREFRED